MGGAAFDGGWGNAHQEVSHGGGVGATKPRQASGQIATLKFSKSGQMASSLFKPAQGAVGDWDGNTCCT